LDTFEINDEEINVEEIMQKIRENIKRRKENEDLRENEIRDSYQHQDQIMNQNNNPPRWADEIKRDLDYVNWSWDIQNNSYLISSHRPVVGKLLVKGRNIVHGEVKRYVDPVINKQREFNESVLRILNSIVKKMPEQEEHIISKLISETEKTIKEEINNAKSEIEGKLDQQIFNAKSEIEGKLDQQIFNAKSEIEGKLDQQIFNAKSEIKGNLDETIGQIRPDLSMEMIELIKSALMDMDHEIYNRTWLANVLGEKITSHYDKETPPGNKELDLNYFLFEEKFRGSRADIKQRQTSFLHYFKGCKNILDIGCGRGELLELLRDNDIIGHGIDIDEEMVNFCISKGFDVEKNDAISYLEKLEDGSLDGIIMDQVIEHLDSNYLIKLLKLCYQKLKFGYYIVIETVNPLSLVSLTNFYIDMSHKRPIHPETLKFLANYANFREVETIFFSPIPDEKRLKKINIEGIEGDFRRLIEVYDQNIDKLNTILYGPQDYAIVAKK